MKLGNRRHKLLTKALEKKLPPLYSGEDKPDSERKIPVKFFSPYTNWTWYALEFCPEERVFFGLVKGFEPELGYFSLEELEQAYKGALPLVERDCYWNANTTLADVQAGKNS